jgi:hypothetical protein
MLADVGAFRCRRAQKARRFGSISPFSQELCPARLFSVPLILHVIINFTMMALILIFLLAYVPHYCAWLNQHFVLEKCARHEAKNSSQ